MLRKLFYLCVITLSLGQFSSITRSEGAHIYLFDIVVGLFAFSGVLYFLIKGRFVLPKVFLPFLGFSFVAIVSLLVRWNDLAVPEFTVAGFYLLRWLIYSTASLVVFNLWVSRQLRVEDVLKVFALSGVFISIAGFIQMIVLPDFTVLDPALGWDPHKNRLASTFFDPNFAGGYLVLCLVSLLALGSGTFSRKYLFQIFVTVILIAVFLTFSRSSWAMLAVVIFIFGLARYRLLLFLSVLLAFSAYFAVPRVQTRLSGTTDPADSAHFRLISWGNTLTIARDNLLLGTGFNTFRYAQKDYGYLTHDNLSVHSGAGSDSSFLLVLSTTGIFGALFFISGYLSMSLNALLSKNSFAIPILTAFTGLLIHSQFVNSLFYPQILFLWSILGCVISYSSSRT